MIFHGFHVYRGWKRLHGYSEDTELVDKIDSLMFANVRLIDTSDYNIYIPPLEVRWFGSYMQDNSEELARAMRRREKVLKSLRPGKTMYDGMKLRPICDKETENLIMKKCANLCAIMERDGIAIDKTHETN